MVTAEKTQIKDTLVLAASHETQRAMLAQWRGDRAKSVRHLLAAGHIELVLAEDYSEAGNSRDSLRCRLSAASCFWRAGDVATARSLFDEMRMRYPAKAKVIDETKAELEHDFPGISKRNGRRKKT